MATLPKYNDEQIAVTMALVADISGNFSGTAAEIAAKTKEKLLSFFHNSSVVSCCGEWELVWGPCVFQHEGAIIHVADNTAFVVKNSNSNKVIVAIAGTNFKSVYDWVIQDGDVFNPVQWSDPSCPKGALVSNGTLTGLTKVLELKEGEGNGRTLHDVLSAQTTGTEVTIAGHSLGGALCQALALWTYEHFQTLRPQLHAVPAASPTVGNTLWTGYFNSVLETKTKFQTNSLDMVSHGWKKTLLEELTSLYKPKPKFPWYLKPVLGIVEDLVGPLNYEHAHYNPWMGTVKTDLDFFEEVVHQHIDAFYDHMCLEEVKKVIDNLEEKKALRGFPSEEKLPPEYRDLHNWSVKLHHLLTTTNATTVDVQKLLSGLSNKEQLQVCMLTMLQAPTAVNA